MHSGQVVVGFLDPLDAPSAIQEAAKKGITAFAIELLPRITRAQSMDALSSMATITGYKAAVIAAEALPKIFPMLMTAAGTLLPARVFVIGAGVAGLMAIATAKRLGAKVRAYDVRPSVKEQVQSLGASFVELSLEQKKAEDESGYARAMDESFYQKQRELLGEVLSESDVVISTALVPGKLAPVLITEAMVQAMPKGSVIVDVAAERGGNCELTKPGCVAVKHGVTILGPTNLPSSVPQHASMMFARNMFNFLKPIFIEGRLEIDLEDQVLRESLVAKDGNVVHPRVIDLLKGG
jgi:NAD(P) transhydrogenase subunit alpha